MKMIFCFIFGYFDSNFKIVCDKIWDLDIIYGSGKKGGGGGDVRVFILV